MLTYDEFGEVLEEEVGLLPDYVMDELSGGVILEEREYPHPDRLADDLYILGTYSRGRMGTQVALYYGSFVRTLQHASDEAVRAQIRETLRHEFLHHMEARAGLYGRGTLIEEDKKHMVKYYMRHRGEK